MDETQRERVQFGIGLNTCGFIICFALFLDYLTFLRKSNSLISYLLDEVEPGFIGCIV